MFIFQLGINLCCLASPCFMFVFHSHSSQFQPFGYFRPGSPFSPFSFLRTIWKLCHWSMSADSCVLPSSITQSRVGFQVLPNNQKGSLAEDTVENLREIPDYRMGMYYLGIRSWPPPWPVTRSDHSWITQLPKKTSGCGRWALHTE